MLFRLLAVLAVAAAALVAPVPAALADHLHSLQVGNGRCVILAQDGNERYVVLPPASFRNTTEPTTTANPHPIHVHVHRGEPGEHTALGVYGTPTDPCYATGDYVND
jgi:hypothetical protein